MSESRRSWWAKPLLEMVMIGLGVFLGMAADQWRTDQQHREQARQALLRFKVEIENNRVAVANVKDYHVATRAAIIKYLNPDTRAASALDLQGIQPANFERTAWDLALATQALAEIDPAVAFELTRIYGAQQTYAGLTNGIIQAMYVRPPEAGWVPFLQSLKVYYDDLIGLEPELLKMYAAVLPLIDRSLRD